MTSKADVMFLQHLTFSYDHSLGASFIFFKERQSSAWLPYTKCNPIGTVGTLETNVVYSHFDLLGSTDINWGMC